ncbi:glycoside hydrolase family 9 protein, partial [Bacteroidota bacterium]
NCIMKKTYQISVISTLTLILLFSSARSLYSQDNSLVLNDKDYFETRGFNVIAFENPYTGFFFDEKTSGIMLIHHGKRTATGGAVRLKPTPEQWDQIPILVERTINRENNSIEIQLKYEDFDFESKVLVRAEGNKILISVNLEKPLPEILEGRAGFNLEFLPTTYMEKTYSMDGVTGIMPLHPSSPMRTRPADTQLRQFAGHSTFDQHGRPEYIEPLPFAEGNKLVLSPEDPETGITIKSMNEGTLRLLDGRTVAQNNWFVARTLIPSGQTGTVIEWELTPHIMPDWIRTPIIGYNQVGYHPWQEKISVIELDKNDTPLREASILKLAEAGNWVNVFTDQAYIWGDFYRNQYVRFDFSSLREPGVYKILYGDQESGPFQIGDQVHETGWHPTMDVWFPVQMDHMFVNEGYKVWHGVAHLDDAIQAPVNHRHFDGYSMGDSTETKYKPGERIPGLNIGGWFDAGDFDIRTGSHSGTVLSMVETWEQFKPERDETWIDQEQRYVDLHHPDGSPDLLQQIEHGTLALIAQHRAFGRAIPGIIVPHLHQYHHLGDGSTMTDNLPYNPNLKPYETDGVSSGTPDDRWAFTMRTAGNSYVSIAALAAASRAMKGYNNGLAEECIATAERAWADEQEQVPDTSRFAYFIRQGVEMRAALQLYISTGNIEYAKIFEESLWPALDANVNRNMSDAIQALPHMDEAFKDRLTPYVHSYKTSNDKLLEENPYGVQITTGGWAGNGSIVRWAITNYQLHKVFPEIIGPEYTYRGVSYIYGNHPYSNISFVSGVGMYSKSVAYGSNRSDYSFIAGGIVPGVLIIKPDFPENMIEWPFLWGENEYVINICADYIYMVNAVDELGKVGK